MNTYYYLTIKIASILYPKSMIFCGFFGCNTAQNSLFKIKTEKAYIVMPFGIQKLL